MDASSPQGTEAHSPTSTHAPLFADNQANWDDRADLHATSGHYGIDELLAAPDELSGVVRFDLPRLGEITGLDVVHLQCHIGTDTISLARLGAASVTGLDFSGKAVAQARDLAERAGAQVTFSEGNVYDAVDVLGAERFDLVYTGIGAICWLPDIERWAATVAALLRPGGRLFIRDCHPMLGAMADTSAPGDALTPAYPYFHRDEPLTWDQAMTYVPIDGEITHTRSHEWAHGLGEIVTACLAAGLTITGLGEHDSVPWCALPGLMSLDEAAGEWRLTDEPDRLAASFTLTARKPTADQHRPPTTSGMSPPSSTSSTSSTRKG